MSSPLMERLLDSWMDEVSAPISCVSENSYNNNNNRTVCKMNFIFY